MNAVTAQEILEQAHATADTVGLEEDADDFVGALWNFAYATWNAAREDGEEVCSLEELEAAFNEPHGCPTGA